MTQGVGAKKYNTGHTVESFAQTVVAHVNQGHGVAFVGAPNSGKTQLLMNVYDALVNKHGPQAALLITSTRAHADVLRDAVHTQGVRSGAAAQSMHSFAFGIVAAALAVDSGQAARFISGADQDAILTTFLASYEQGRVPGPAWPEGMGSEVRHTPAFRAQLRDALAEIMAEGLSFADVEYLAAHHRRPEWGVIAHIGKDYEGYLSLSGPANIDYAALFAFATQTVLKEKSTGARAGEKWSFSNERIPRFLLIDATQDLPDAALSVMHALTHLGVILVMTGCLESATQSFRGGTGRVLQEAMNPAGGLSQHQYALPAWVDSSDTDPHIHELTLELSRALALPSLRFGHVPAVGRKPTVEPESTHGVFTHVSSTAADNIRFIVARIVEALESGVPPQDIAVLTRTSASAVRMVGELTHAGLPVTAVEESLAANPATAIILRALSYEPTDPAWGDLAIDILRGPYGVVSSLRLRALERTVRALLAQQEPTEQQAVVGTEGFFRLFLVRDVTPAEGETQFEEELTWLKTIYAAAQNARLKDPESAVWDMWEALGAADAWYERALAEPRGPIAHYLDAVLRLQALAEKLHASGDGHLFARTVLEQTFAQDSLAQTAQTRTLTVATPANVAHHKFTTVIIADLETGVWPNPKVRGSIFKAPELLENLHSVPVEARTSTNYTAARKKTIIDEAKLLIAAVSRARKTLYLCSVNDGETSPSGFFNAITESVQTRQYTHDHNTVKRLQLGDHEDVPTTLNALVGLARRKLEAAAHPAEQSKWAQLLKSLAQQGISSADIDNWAGWTDISSIQPLFGPQDVVRISPSQIETFAQCPLKWFATAYGSSSPRTVSQSLGTLLHTIAQNFATAPLDVKQQEFDCGFADLQFTSDLQRESEYEAGLDMVECLHDYLKARPDVDFVGTEYSVQVQSAPDDPAGPWQLSGRIDRLEVKNSRAKVIDFKTGKAAPTKEKAEEHLQLAAYQAALNAPNVIISDGNGEAVSGITGPDGGELVFIRLRLKNGPTIRSQAAQHPHSDQHVRIQELIADISTTSRSTRMLATPSKEACTHCPIRRSCPAQFGVEGELA